MYVLVAQVNLGEVDRSKGGISREDTGKEIPEAPPQTECRWGRGMEDGCVIESSEGVAVYLTRGPPLLGDEDNGADTEIGNHSDSVERVHHNVVKTG